MQHSKTFLVDHFVGAVEQRRQHSQAKRLRGFEIDSEIEFGRILNWQVGWAITFEDAVDVPCRLAHQFRKINAICDEAAARVTRQALFAILET